MRTCAWLFVLIVYPLSALGSDTAPAGKVMVNSGTFRGWDATYQLDNGRIAARVVTAIGPRIVDLHATGGRNLLHLRDGEAGHRGEDHWMFRGGWRLWVAPERKATTYALDNTACEAAVQPDGSLLITGPPQPEAGIRKQVRISLAANENRLHLHSRIENISNRPLTYAAWSLSVMQPGGRAFLPLDVGPLDAFDATRRLLLWSYTRMGDPRYRFGDRLAQVDQAKIAPARQKAENARGADESKIGVDSAQGWAAYLLGDTLYLKRFPHHDGAIYPDGGATIEVYSNAEFLELEHLGPLTTIQPGEAIDFPEDWWVFTGVSIPTDEAGALAALRPYVDRTPFR
jgi:Domain of unknown function (DUF4380)